MITKYFGRIYVIKFIEFLSSFSVLIEDELPLEVA